MSLTRDEWLEMWANIKLMEKTNQNLMIQLKFIQSPYRKQVIRDMIKVNEVIIDQMKYQVQSVIGQME